MKRAICAGTLCLLLVLGALVTMGAVDLRGFPSTPVFSGLSAVATLGSEQAPALTAGNWTVGSGWESPIVGPGLIKNADGTGTQTPSAASTIVTGTTYKVTITLSALSVGTATYTLGGTNGVSTLAAATTYTDYVTAINTAKLIITPTNTSRFTISAISIVPLSGGSTTLDGTVTLRSPLTFWTRLLGPDGSGSVPAYTFTNATTTGMYRVAASGSIGLAVAGTTQALIGSAGITLSQPLTLVSSSSTEMNWTGTSPVDIKAPSNLNITFDSDGSESGAAFMDIFWNTSRVLHIHDPAVGVIEYGPSTNSPATFEFKTGDALSAAAGNNFRLKPGEAAGTNQAGATLYLWAGQPTGNAQPGTILLQGVPLGGASGTTVGTSLTRHTINTERTLTNNTATALVNLTLGTDTAAAVILDYHVEAVDTTNHKVQTEVGQVVCNVAQENAAVGGNVCTKLGNQQYVGASALTVTWTVTAASPAVLTITANSTLAALASGYPRLVYELRNLGNASVAIQ